MLTPQQRVRFARHRSLAEIGDAGQDALLAASCGPALGAASAEATRRLYLVRAGLDPASDPSSAECGPDEVEAFAGSAYLREAAASCLGAMHAVERIKRLVSAGQPANLPPPASLIENA